MSRPDACSCGCGRPVKSRRLSNACYLRAWLAGTLPPLPERRCIVCSLPFSPEYDRAEYCSDTCRHFWRGRVLAAQRRSSSDDYLATHDAGLARAAAKALRDRGFRRVGPQARRAAIHGAYFSAWRKSTRRGHHLYVVRWYDPAERAEAAA